MPAKTHKAVALPLVDAGAQLKQAKALDKVAKKERKLAKAAAQEAAVAVEAPADVEMTTEDSSAALEAKAARKAAKKDKKKMQALQQVAQDVEMTPAAPALPKSSKRKALDVEPVVPAKKSKLVATSESAPLSPVASTSAVQPAPVAAVNKVYTAPARPVYARSVTDLNIPGVSAPRPAPSPSPTKKTTTQAPALHSSLLDADDDAVLAALQRVGLRKSPPHVSPVKKTAAASAKGKGKETNEETPEEMKARTKAEKKEAKRLAKELAANPPPLPAADAPEDLLADALASYKSTIPVIPREVVVKRKPVKIAVVKAGKAAKAPKEGKAPKMSLDDLASLDVKELLCTKFLTGAQVKALAEKKGFTPKAGKFSATEAAIVKSTVEDYQKLHSLEIEDIYRLCASKDVGSKEGLPDSRAFFITIANALDLRPLHTVHNYVKRVYAPLYKMGAWTQEQDTALLASFKEHGPIWKKIGVDVGRAAADCKDRYLEDLKFPDRILGEWSASEIESLREIVARLGTKKGKTQPWENIGVAFGPTRSPKQIRERWTGVESKQKEGEEKSTPWRLGQTAKLVKQIKKLKYKDETEIDWSKVEVDGWGSRPKGKHLKTILDIARQVPGYSFRKTIKAACKQYNDVDSTLPLPRTSAKAIRKKQKEAAPSTSKSAEFISASDDEDSSEEDKMEE